MTNKLIELKASFTNGDLTKHEFLQEVSSLNDILFQYANFITNSQVEYIQVCGDKVFLQARKTKIKLCLSRRDFGLCSNVLLALDHYEEKLWQDVARILGQPDIFFDIGGNVGYFTLFFRRIFPKSKFYFFEPIPSTYANALKNFELNSVKDIAMYNIVFLDKTTKLEMFHSDLGSGGSSLRNLQGLQDTQKIQCQFMKLDEFFYNNHIEKIDVIKCDVEGAEKFVYEGGAETISKHRPIIISEMLRKWSAKFNYHPNDIISFFSSLDYKVHAMSEDGIRSIEEISEDTKETNFLFLPNR